MWAGGAQYALFNKLFPRILPGLTARNPHVKSALSAAVLDNFVHIPVFYLPVFYTVQQVALHPERPPMENVREASRLHRENIFWDQVRNVTIMMPVQIANFKLNPPHLRVPTVLLAGVVWVVALSVTRGDVDEGDEGSATLDARAAH